MALMLGITDIGTFILGTIFIILLPGPNSLYVLSVAAQRGLRAGYRAALGVFLGDAILMLLSAAGAASLLKANPEWFLLIKCAGALYLAYIGLTMFWGAIKKMRSSSAASQQPAQRADASQPFAKALMISLLNPKAILFFISFFIQFVDPAYQHPALTFLALGTVVQICSFVYLSALILIGARLAEQFRHRRRLAAGLTGGVGALFIGFGGKLVSATLT